MDNGISMKLRRLRDYLNTVYVESTNCYNFTVVNLLGLSIMYPLNNTHCLMVRLFKNFYLKRNQSVHLWLISVLKTYIHKNFFINFIHSNLLLLDHLNNRSYLLNKLWSSSFLHDFEIFIVALQARIAFITLFPNAEVWNN